MAIKEKRAYTLYGWANEPRECTIIIISLKLNEMKVFALMYVLSCGNNLYRVRKN